jgi:hypothetical protein
MAIVLIVFIRQISCQLIEANKTRQVVPLPVKREYSRQFDSHPGNSGLSQFTNAESYFRKKRDEQIMR